MFEIIPEIEMATRHGGAGALRSYDPIASEYDQHAPPQQDMWDQLTLDCIRSLTPARQGRVLDAGAGTGRLSLHFLREGHHVTLLDPSPAMLDVARAKVEAGGFTDVAFVEAGMHDMPLPDAAFDLVFSDGDPLCYCIGSQREAAGEILRVLRPGGGFYVSCDNRWIAVLGRLLQGDLETALQCASSGQSVDPYGNPVHAFDPTELAMLFGQAGAVDVRVTGKGHLSTFVAAPRMQDLLRGGQATATTLIDMEKRLADDPRMAAMAAHLQVTGRKKGTGD